MVMQGQGVSNIAPRRRTRSAGERMALGIRSIDPVRNHGRCGGSLSPRNSGISCVGHHSTRSGGSAVSAQDVHLYLGRKLVARSRLSSRSVQPGRFLSGGAIFPRHDFNEGLFLVRKLALRRMTEKHQTSPRVAPGKQQKHAITQPDRRRRSWR